MNELALNYQGKNVRTEQKDGELWWVAKDICDVLGLSNIGQAISRLDDDEKSEVIGNDVTGRKQELSIVSESGLYKLIFSSTKEEAKAFKKWVTSDVLPQIRKTGGYMSKPMTQIQLMKRSVEILERQEQTLLEQGRKIEQIESRVSDEAISKMVKNSLSKEQVNIFPTNCIDLEGIRKKYYQGISEANISQHLQSVQHPGREFSKLLSGNEIRSCFVYVESGLREARERLRMESSFQKETKGSLQYFHPALGNYRIKKNEMGKGNLELF